jgi:hypothetical protein
VVKVDTAENLPSGAKAHRFLLTLYGTAEQLAEKLPGLKPALFCWLYAGVETPASLRIELFRGL